MTKPEILDVLGAKGCRIEPVGSRITCNPPPTNTDADYLVLIPAALKAEVFIIIDEYGFSFGGSHVPDDINYIPEAERFHSYREGDDNLITTTSETFFHRSRAASSIAKRLNLMVKADRIALFQAVLYGNAANDMQLEELTP